MTTSCRATSSTSWISKIQKITDEGGLERYDLRLLVLRGNPFFVSLRLNLCWDYSNRKVNLHSKILLLPINLGFLLHAFVTNFLRRSAAKVGFLLAWVYFQFSNLLLFGSVTLLGVDLRNLKQCSLRLIGHQQGSRIFTKQIRIWQVLVDEIMPLCAQFVCIFWLIVFVLHFF